MNIVFNSLPLSVVASNVYHKFWELLCCCLPISVAETIIYVRSVSAGLLPCFCCSHRAADWPGSGSQWLGPRSPSPPHSGLQSATSAPCSTRQGSQSCPPLKQKRHNRSNLEQMNHFGVRFSVL